LYANILLKGSSDECVSVVNKMKNSRFNIHEQENSTLIPNCSLMFILEIVYDKKSLKIPKNESELVNRQTDNTITKGKRTKGQTKINNILHITTI
jgi:hypothetical protein